MIRVMYSMFLLVVSSFLAAGEHLHDNDVAAVVAVIIESLLSGRCLSSSSQELHHGFSA